MNVTFAHSGGDVLYLGRRLSFHMALGVRDFFTERLSEIDLTAQPEYGRRVAATLLNINSAIRECRQWHRAAGRVI